MKNIPGPYWHKTPTMGKEAVAKEMAELNQMGVTKEE
jgi:hypothetical protein